jgi:hypothetical protein
MANTMPPGEGAFGIAKLAPLLFFIAALVFFCLIWFPANLAVWLWYRRNSGSKLPQEGSPVIPSGFLFTLALSASIYYFSPHYLHKVRFLEKLEDQYGQPVPDALIRVSRMWDSRYTLELKSDSKGNFKLTCRPGDTFSFMPYKEGYALASLNTSAAYSEELRIAQKAHPPPNPTLIKMWKLQGAERLIGIDKTYKLHYTNTPMRFDLIAGRIVDQGGDLQITITRPPGIISGRNPQAWSARFEAIDGGLMDSAGTERITYFAPEAGYNPSRTISSTDRLPEGGTGAFRTGFYVKSRAGRIYSKLSVSVGINETPNDPMYIELNGLANTNGSRNWEGDLNTYRPQVPISVYE